MSDFLEFEKIQEYIGTLRVAVENGEVRTALDDLAPILLLLGPIPPRVGRSCELKHKIVKGVTKEEFGDLLKGLVEVGSPNDKFLVAVNNMREELKLM